MWHRQETSAKKATTYTGALNILKVALSYDYLWINIRVKGGAYGCMSGFKYSGESFFVSYRDPHLKRTLGCICRNSGLCTWLSRQMKEK